MGIVAIALHKLRSLVEVVDRGSFTAAAGALGVAQSALSRHVKELEAQFGHRLLHRTGRGVVPTEIAHSFMPRLRALARESEQLLDDIVAARGAVLGRVQLGMLQSLSGLVLTPLLVEVSTRFPRLEMRVREGLADHVEEWLASGQADLGVLYARHSDARAGSELLMTADLFLVGAAGDPRLAAGACPLREVSALPLILPAFPNRWRLTIEDACASRALPLTVAHELDSLQTIKDFIKTPGHYSILPLHAVQREIDAGHLGASRVVEPAIARKVVLRFSARQPMSYASKTVADILRRQIRAQLTSKHLTDGHPS